MEPLDPMGWRKKDMFGGALKGRMIFSKVWGSHSHNTDMPESDVDYLGVYAADTDEILGMYPPPETLDGKKPDFQIHEVGKFCSLLIKGNPGIIEMLFTDRMFWMDESFETIMEDRHRKKFLTKNVVTQYLGYMQGQLRKFAAGGGLHTKGGQYSEKWGYHMVRLGEDALRIAQGTHPVVWKEGLERERLMEIRRGEWSKDAVEKEATDLIHRIDTMKPWPIPDEADAAWLNKWLLSIRKG